jgi:NAD(P)-dependent dehydrogenase (short-subunit alcohol dehydrogenase family)
MSEIAPIADMFRVDEKVALVTGASSGLGVRFAKVLAQSGAELVLVARRAERLESLAAELGGAAVIPADLSVPGSGAVVVAKMLEAKGRVDIVVNNAGISRVLPAVSDDSDEFRRELEINLVAPYDIARHSAIAMIEAGTGGSIVNIGSVLGSGGGGRLKVPGYAASKGGVHNLTRELGSQWARKGIRVNAIAPAFFESEMATEIFATDAGKAYVAQMTPMGRGGQPHELDGALLFLASAASSFVTGHVLFVDGGWTSV